MTAEKEELRAVLQATAEASGDRLFALPESRRRLVLKIQGQISKLSLLCNEDTATVLRRLGLHDYASEALVVLVEHTDFTANRLEGYYFWLESLLRASCEADAVEVRRDTVAHAGELYWSRFDERLRV